MRKEILNEHWTCEGTLGYRPCVRALGKLRPVSVERVLRQDLLESLSQRTGDRERLRIFTSLTSRYFLAEFQKLKTGLAHPETCVRRADHREPARISLPTPPYAPRFQLKVNAINQHFSRNLHSASAPTSGRSPRWAPVLAPRPSLHISRRIPLKVNPLTYSHNSHLRAWRESGSRRTHSTRQM